MAGGLLDMFESIRNQSQIGMPTNNLSPESTFNNPGGRPNIPGLTGALMNFELLGNKPKKRKRGRSVRKAIKGRRR